MHVRKNVDDFVDYIDCSSVLRECVSEGVDKVC